MAELPLHLKQLEPLPSALDIIRYLHGLQGHAASVEDICDALDISDRRFGKANRRLVTNGYLAMQANFVYELTPKGIRAAEELATYDAIAPVAPQMPANKIQRDFLVALPRNLVAHRGAPVHLAFTAGQAGNQPMTIALRLDATHADLSTADELIMLDANQSQHTITITPKPYDRARLRVHIFQLSPDGETVNPCGGLYVDVDVDADGELGGLVAYGTTITLDPT